MPTLTLTLDDPDAIELASQAEQAKLPPEQLAERMLKRQLYRLTGPARSRLPTGSQPNAARAVQRSARQLRLLEHVRRHGMPKGLIEKRALADQLKVTPRTLYRDLDAVSAVLQQTPIGRTDQIKWVDGRDGGPARSSRPRRASRHHQEQSGPEARTGT